MKRSARIGLCGARIMPGAFIARFPAVLIHCQAEVRGHPYAG